MNFREIAEVKKRYPKNLVIASLMVESKRETWHEMVRRAEDAGADALELNFGCPHGMSERGMGSSVGQVPEYTEMITSWVKEAAKTPVIVKLTPNVTDITRVALAAEKGGADAVSLINTLNSIDRSGPGNIFAEAQRGREILARRLLRAGAEADRVAPGFQRGEKSEDSDRAGSAESDTGTTRRNTSRSGRRSCKCARRRCITGSASSKT